MNPSIISIDWGGSKARVAIASETGIVKSFTTKSANIRQLSSKQIEVMASEILTKTTITQPATCLIGAAGAGNKNAVRMLETTFLKMMSKGSKVHIYPDYLCNHAAAFAGADGILCVNGTGSIIYAYYNQSIIKKGGFGYLIDRSPSGAYFGRKALQLMLDTNAATRNDFSRIYNNLGLTDSSDILISRLYSTGEPQRFLGQFAPIMTRAYDLQNKIAQTIVAESFNHMIEQLLSCMPKNYNLPLCLYGGLWDGWAAMKELFKQKLKTANIQLKIIEARFPSELGPLIHYKNSTDFTARLAAQLKSQEQTK